jgi:hypothetical protein
MDTRSFYQKFQAGTIGDSADFFEWNTYYEMGLYSYRTQFMHRSNSGWESIFGSFANCPEFDEMEAFGKAWRSAQNEVPVLE